ncbi:hypothetical protein [Dactylosporangium sp. NPDC051484]|uniref:hypothetical protein n=1 Tax=Dactylosporangium sp. NPDC051484 TaxID=3154942 RepID=UPI00344F70BD
MRIAAETVCEPDAGIWELGADRWTSSRLTAAAAGMRVAAAVRPRRCAGRRGAAAEDAYVYRYRPGYAQAAPHG